MPDGIDSCIARVTTAHGGNLSNEDARDMLALVDERAERLQREHGLSPQEAALRAGKELSDAESAAGAVETRNRLLNLQKRVGRRQRIEDTAADVGKAGEPDYAHAVMNQVVARNAPTMGNRLSAEAVWKTRLADYAGGLSVALQKAGLLKAFRDGAMQRDWARELYELSIRAAGEKDHFGFTGNAAAGKVAEIVHGVQQLSKERLNREGAWIGDYAGYITRTAHDMNKVRRAGFEKWRDFIAPRLAAETFDGVENREAFLRQAYNAITTGVHLTDRDYVGLKDPAFSGPGNAAKRLSQGRKLHFNNADAWLDYQQSFGRGSLVEQTLGALERGARQEALLQRWGTNPEAEFEQDFRALEEKNRDAHPDAVRKLRDAQSAIQRRFDYLTGEATRPENELAAKIGASVRAVESMAKLGGVAFTHLSSFVTKAAELRYHGVGWLEAYGNSVSSVMQGRGRGEARELADLLLAGTEGMHGDMLSRFHADDAPSGTMSKLTNRFFSMSGLTYLLDAQKSGMQRVMSRWLGRNIGHGFDGLPPELQRSLRSYDISPGEWDTLRTAPDHTTVDGRVHLTPDAATRAGLEPAAADKLALKLHALYADVADRGIITPGIDERAMLLGGTKAGTLAGEALRFVAQFKMWGVAAARQGLGRELYGGQGAAAAVSGIAQMALGAAAIGYLTMTLKDLAKGETPRNPLDPRTIMAALIQGGGFGVIGDYMFGQFSRFGQSLVETLAGPTAGLISDVMRVVDTARGAITGDPNVHAKDAGPEVLRLVEDNTPFINLFYVRRALDYLMLHSLQESMNPGYLRRSERSLQQRSGQTFVLPPSNHLKPFGH